MLYDTVYALGYLFQEFLQDNPDLLEDLSPSYLVDDDEHAVSAGHPAIERRLLAWLDRQPVMTDPVQRAILLQMAQEYIQLESEQDSLPTLVAP